MEQPKLLLQTGDFMRTEKLACAFSSYPTLHAPYEKISRIGKEYRLNTVPVGTVEFVQEWCRHMDLSLPQSSLGFPDFFQPFLHRNIREGTFGEALPSEFVKPCAVKRFTGGIKSTISEEIPTNEPVWISDSVPFESEFRFYIYDFVTGPKILGWARYDDTSFNNPGPDFGLVEDVAEEYHRNLGPSAYSIDIGWRSDIGRYSLIETNDAWALGLYENTDRQSSPPSRQAYADMIVSRWRQILFCNVI